MIAMSDEEKKPSELELLTEKYLILQKMFLQQRIQADTLLLEKLERESKK